MPVPLASTSRPPGVGQALRCLWWIGMRLCRPNLPTSDRHAIMPSPFHSREKLFNADENHRPTFIHPGEFLYSLHGIESQQGKELHFIAFLANKQFCPMVSGDVSRSDSWENFAAQHCLVTLCVR